MRSAVEERARGLQGLVRSVALALTLSLPLSAGAAPGWGGPTCASPIAVTIDDKLIWTVNPSDNSVSVIRADVNALLAKIPVGKEPRSVALTPDNRYAYVANAASNSVTAIRINDPAWSTFNAVVDTTFGTNGHLITGAEPWSIVTSPDGNRVFVANSQQDTITVLNATTRTLLGHVHLRPDPFAAHFQPRGLAVTADNSKLYVTRFLSSLKPGGRQGSDLGKQGKVDVLRIDTSSTNILNYTLARTITLNGQASGFMFASPSNPAVPTSAFPNQLQSIVLRGDRAYLPNIAASPEGPLRFDLDTHAFVNLIGGVNGTSPTDLGALNLHLGARDPEPGKRRLFFANPWAIAFTTPSGAGNAYVVSAGSDLLVKLNVNAAGDLTFTGDSNTTRYIDLDDPLEPATSGANAGKNPQGIALNSAGTRAYVANFVSRNVSVVDLTKDQVIATVPTSDLPTPGSPEETRLVGAEMFFSSRGNFNAEPGTTVSVRNRLSSEGWQSCASCHPAGLADGVVWQSAAGPRKTVPLNATFSPHNRNQQRVLNYSAIFDEVEDFETKIRDVCGPGPRPNGGFDPNHGLLLSDSGNPNLPPDTINAFALPNANRPQFTVTLPGSPNKVPALTALREWVRFSVRTPNTLVPGLPGYHPVDYISAGRGLFLTVGCVRCHGGPNWTMSVKDFNAPPASAELFTERDPVPLAGNPVRLPYLNRFLRDIGSFNLGVPGRNNNFGSNVGAEEKAAPLLSNGTLQTALDALGLDYNGDGKGNGFNVPSLLGIASVPPYLHNGAAENLLTVLSDVKHRTGGGILPDRLTGSLDQIKLFAFLETIDASTVPFPATGP